MSKDRDEDDLLSGVWPEWKIVEFIGSGSYGRVYKAVRDDFSIQSFSAVKIISIPQNDSEIQELRAEGYDDAAIKKYYQNITSQLVSEMECLISLKGATNIVKIDDFKIVDKEYIGCNIYLRMELLTPVNQYILGKKLSQAEIIKLGRDICKALEHCNVQNIVHRDIKLDNILVSEHGEFKLGDFGIAKRLNNESATMNYVGGSGYIAPEVFKGEKYNIRADIYSLGMVLYKLLNNNQFPFANQDGEYGLSLSANMRRLNGEKLPAPVDASKELSSVILRACEYAPDKRFQSPVEFGHALVALGEQTKVTHLLTIDDTTEKTLIADQKMFEPERSGSGKKILLIGIVLLMILFAGGVVFAMSADKIFTESDMGSVDFDTSETEEITKESSDDSANEDIGEENSKPDSEATDEETNESDSEITDEETNESDSENFEEENTDDSEFESEKITETEEEVAIEESTTEEPTTEEPTTEESTTEESTTEEVTTEEVTTEEVTTENTTEKSLYIVPSGCTYYDASSGEVYPTGCEINITPEIGDELRTADYVYIYDNMQALHDDLYHDEYNENLSYTWRVTVKDKSKTVYEDIIDTIAGEKVESMYATFEECVNMKVAPKIPDTVSDLCYTFWRCELLEMSPKLPNNVRQLNRTFIYCSSLKEIPEIPNGVNILNLTFAYCYSLRYIENIPDSVTDMVGTFRDCYSIETVDKLPVGVKNLNETFSGCKALKKSPEIPNSVETMQWTFQECESLREAPVIPDKVKSLYQTFLYCYSLEKVPVIPDGVENLRETFWACENLKEIPPIPKSVKDMRSTFYLCKSLQGEIIVNANPEEYSRCFKELYNITLKGSSNMLEELETTKWE